ncbi:MAG: TonB family protein [Zoogloeaceae bacterium]|jgi:TonB family protein|nr:TonB family protein [Zoogloeaceae bacterium]
MQERSGLAVALACSLLGHGMLLFAMSPLRPPVQTPRPTGAIEASLRADAAPASPSLPAWSPEPPETTAKLTTIPKPRVPASPGTRVISTPMPTPDQLPAPDAAIAVSTGTEPENEPALPMVAAQSSGTGNVGGASGQGAAAAEGMDDALQDYFFAISSAAGKFKRYPALSRTRGREGRVEVRLSWHSGMREPRVELYRGAEDALLNEQGLSMLRQAAAQTPLPPALRERAFSLVLPVEFSLKDVKAK